MEEQKEIARKWALQWKKDTGKFPLVSDWLVKKNKSPFGRNYLCKIFGGYNKFRNFCEEKELIRTDKITIEWIKNNCVINCDNCWIWQKTLYKDGYGQVGYNNKVYATHRLSFELVKGTIPTNILVRHKCDIKNCCNPEHLELGTRSDNQQDIIKRNTNIAKKGNVTLSNQTRNLSIKEKIEFYLKHIDIINNNCWISNKLVKSIRGYYQIGHKGKRYFLHRLLLANKIGKNYKEIQLTRHTCNNSSCINPEHLIEGTNSDNSIDSRNYSKNTILTEKDVIAIKKELVNEDFSILGSKQLFEEKWAKKFKVSTGTIKNIRNNQTWKDIRI